MQFDGRIRKEYEPFAMYSRETKLISSTVHEDDVFHGLTFHRLGLILSAGFGLFAVILLSLIHI